jgi:hypothetical protein
MITRCQQNVILDRVLKLQQYRQYIPSTLWSKMRRSSCFQNVQTCTGCGNRLAEKDGGGRKRTTVYVSLLLISSELHCMKDM